MKKNRLLVPALSILVGVSLAGSISGTIAWYQYTTRADAMYFGTSAGTIGNLQFRIKSNDENNPDKNPWLTRLLTSDIDNYLSENGYGSKIQPITSGGKAKNDALGVFYANPIVGRGPYARWQKATKANYFSLDLEFRFVKKERADSADAILVPGKKVYLTDLSISEDLQEGKSDISDAVRFHIHTPDGVDRLISKKGETIETGGHLDLDNDGNLDKGYPDNDPYGFKGGAYDFVDYGSGAQEAYAAKVDGGILAETNDDNLDIDKLDLDGVAFGKSIGSTKASGDDYLTATITIWVEGWQKLADDSSIWKSNYIGSKFNIGFEFAVDID